MDFRGKKYLEIPLTDFDTDRPLLADAYIFFKANQRVMMVFRQGYVPDAARLEHYRSKGVDRLVIIHPIDHPETYLSSESYQNPKLPGAEEMAERSINALLTGAEDLTPKKEPTTEASAAPNSPKADLRPEENIQLKNNPDSVSEDSGSQVRSKDSVEEGSSVAIRALSEKSENEERRISTGAEEDDPERRFSSDETDQEKELRFSKDASAGQQEKRFTRDAAEQSQMMRFQSNASESNSNEMIRISGGKTENGDPQSEKRFKSESLQTKDNSVFRIAGKSEKDENNLGEYSVRIGAGKSEDGPELSRNLGKGLGGPEKEEDPNSVIGRSKRPNSTALKGDTTNAASDKQEDEAADNSVQRLEQELAKSAKGSPSLKEDLEFQENAKASSALENEIGARLSQKLKSMRPEEIGALDVDEKYAMELLSLMERELRDRIEATRNLLADGGSINTKSYEKHIAETTHVVQSASWNYAISDTLSKLRVAYVDSRDSRDAPSQVERRKSIDLMVEQLFRLANLGKISIQDLSHTPEPRRPEFLDKAHAAEPPREHLNRLQKGLEDLLNAMPAVRKKMMRGQFAYRMVEELEQADADIQEISRGLNLSTDEFLSSGLATLTSIALGYSRTNYCRNIAAISLNSTLQKKGATPQEPWSRELESLSGNSNDSLRVRDLRDILAVTNSMSAREPEALRHFFLEKMDSDAALLQSDPSTVDPRLNAMIQDLLKHASAKEFVGVARRLAIDAGKELLSLQAKSN